MVSYLNGNLGHAHVSSEIWGESIHSMDCMWPAVYTDCGQLNVVSVSGSVTAQWSNEQTSSSVTYWKNCNGDARNVGPGVCEGSCEQKMCLRMVQKFSRREGNDWGWARFGSPIDEQNSRNEGGFQMCTFCGRECHQRSMTAVLRSIPQEAFADCFRKLYERCQTCVVADGDYFQGQ